MKAKLISFIFFLLSTTCFSQQIKYTVSKDLWADTLGNHRAALYVDKSADAVEVKIDWRRRDEMKPILLVNMCQCQNYYMAYSSQRLFHFFLMRKNLMSCLTKVKFYQEDFFTLSQQNLH